MMPPRERYQRDLAFKMLVDLLVRELVTCTYTPTELREAVILAAQIHAERYQRPRVVLDPTCAPGEVEFRGPDGARVRNLRVPDED